jgi:FtsP/CotA-like multicopper oxidase with cupredoxin domain
MTGRQRIALLAVAAVVLVAGLVIASSGGGEEDGGSGGAGTTTAPATAPEARTQPAEQPAEATPAPPRVETIRMRGGAPAGEPRTLRFERGDTIRLRFVSDVPDEVHIHGFDREVEVPGGGTPRRVRFEANIEGVFEVEAHESGELLAKLEVRPR